MPSQLHTRYVRSFLNSKSRTTVLRAAIILFRQQQQSLLLLVSLPVLQMARSRPTAVP
jgi:hypothetical protein